VHRSAALPEVGVHARVALVSHLDEHTAAVEEEAVTGAVLHLLEGANLWGVGVGCVRCVSGEVETQCWQLAAGS
jgi:hypothetical protein